jgi:hypothetical protein
MVIDSQIRERVQLIEDGDRVHRTFDASLRVDVDDNQG